MSSKLIPVFAAWAFLSSCSSAVRHIIVVNSSPSNIRIEIAGGGVEHRQSLSSGAWRSIDLSPYEPLRKSIARNDFTVTSTWDFGPDISLNGAEYFATNRGRTWHEPDDGSYVIVFTGKEIIPLLE